MTFPAIASSTTADAGANVTTLAVAYPASIAAGDLLLLAVAFDGAGDSASAPGFTELGNARASALTDNGAGYWLARDADGTESGTVTVTITGGIEHIVAGMLRIPAAGWHGDVATGVAFAGFGNTAASSAAPNPPSLAAPWGVADTLWIAGAAWDGGIDFSAYPTGWTGVLEVSPSGSGAFGLAVASLDSASSPVDPPAFTLAASEQWAAFTLAVRPAAGGEAHGASVTATGGGVAVLARTGVELAGRSITATGSGSAVLAATGDEGDPPELHGASVTATGSGSAVLARTGVELAGRSITATGGGVAAVSGSEYVAPPAGCEVDGVYWDLRGDVGELPFILDVSLLDADPGSELTSAEDAAETSLGDRILSATWRWGPTAPLGPLTLPTAGQLTAILIDTERDLDPLNAESPWIHTLRFGLPMRLVADDAPVFTGSLASWSHDQRTHTARLTLDGPLAEVGRLDAPRAPVATPGGTLSWTQRDLFEWGMTEAGWPADRLVFSEVDQQGWLQATPGELVDLSDPTSFLAERALAGLALVAETRAGLISWRGPVNFRAIDSSGGGVPPQINCDGVDVDELESGMARDRIRNAVTFTGTPSSGEWDPLDPFDPAPVVVDEESIARNGRRIIRADVDELRLGQMLTPYGHDADPSAWTAVNTGVDQDPADAYELELWSLSTDGGTAWDGELLTGIVATTPDPLGHGVTESGTFGATVFDPDKLYMWRIRFRSDTTGAWGRWIGARFTPGSEDRLADPADYRSWGETIVDQLADPRPLPVLTGLRPKTPAEVVDVARAEAGDVWSVLHTHVSPPIILTVRVLGETCRLGPSGLEVDAITEDLAGEPIA